MLANYTNESYVSVVLADSDKSEHPPRLVANYEVSLSPDSTEFPRWSVIDCRWVMSYPRAIFQPQDLRFQLSDSVMERISIAITNGLNL